MTLQHTMAWPTALSFHPKQEQHQPHNSYKIIDLNLTHCFHNVSRCPSLNFLFTVFQAVFLTATHSRKHGTVLLGSSIQHYKEPTSTLYFTIFYELNPTKLFPAITAASIPPSALTISHISFSQDSLTVSALLHIFSPWFTASQIYIYIYIYIYICIQYLRITITTPNKKIYSMFIPDVSVKHLHQSDKQ